MANYATGNIRTVALVGQGGSGKTTLAEALLLASGGIKEAGTIERNTTVSDFDPLEKSWQHSLRASVLHLDTQDTRALMKFYVANPYYAILIRPLICVAYHRVLWCLE